MINEFATIIVNSDTDVVALEVHLLAVLAVAIGCAAHCLQIFFCWLFQEHIDIAFNLLSGRPINLAILLEAFLVLFGPVFILEASSPTLVVDSVTIAPMATVVPTVCRFAFSLHAITLCILLEVLAVRFLARLEVSSPLVIGALEDAELLAQPLTHGVVHFHFLDFGQVLTIAVPGGVRQQAAILLNLHGAMRFVEVVHESIQTTAGRDVVFVKAQEIIPTFFVGLTIASSPTGTSPTLWGVQILLLLAFLEAMHGL